jgi:signal transduction histidine kinase
LKNPLNSIIGYSEILIDCQESLEDQKCQDLMSIRSAGHKLLELIDDLLDLSKLEAGRMKLQLDAIEFRGLFDGIAAKWRATIVENGSEFLLEPPPSGQIVCDAAKVRRVIDSLLSNAAKFTKNGRVIFSAAVRNENLVITIKDTGAGIAANRISGLFDTFRHSEEETASKYADDVRLGLPLAHRYCHLMGGALSVESDLGVGSCFTIRLPVQSPGNEGLPLPHSKRPPLMEAA